MANQHAVLVDQRHDVGHGAERGESNGLQEEIFHARRDSFGSACLLTERPGQFHGHARAAQPGERIIAAGQMRMHNGCGLGQLRAWLVMIGDDQFDAQLAGERPLRRCCRCRNRR